MKLSVIVPVYKTEKVLRRCLDSILNQTYKNLEIIVINDGSPDHSKEILDEYASAYDNIHVIHQSNKGIGETRNVGLRAVTGDYFTFVDSDDEIKPDMYEKMMHHMTEGPYDVVRCDVEYVEADGKHWIKRIPTEECLNQTSIKEDMCFFYPVLWNTIFDSKLLKHDIWFSQGVWYEDMDWLYRIVPYIHSIGVIHEPFNLYYQNPSAITHTFDSRLFDYLKNCQNIIDFYQSRNLYEEYHDELEYSCIRYLYATFLSRVIKIRDMKVYKEAYRQAKEFVGIHFKNYRSNPYLRKAGLKGLYLKYFCWPLALIVYLVRR